MDVVNLSLGGSSGWPDEPFAIACSAYIDKGLHIAIANGNDGELGLFEDAAPATAVGAIAVGSVDNTQFLGIAGDLYWKTTNQQGYGTTGLSEDSAHKESSSVGRIAIIMAANDLDIPVTSFRNDIDYMVYIPMSNLKGCHAYDPTLISKSLQTPMSHIVVLLRRGDCTFDEKAKLVVAAKLGGMLVYDTVPQQQPLSMTVNSNNVSAAGLSFEDATIILDAMTSPRCSKYKSQGKKLTVNFSGTDQILQLASGGKVSDFSSWGPDARLRYKPDIVAPGGMIHSTFPLAKGGLATLQGTSMASPYMAGIQALYLSKFGKTDALTLLNLLQSTAVPTARPSSAIGLASVYQQGGGLVSLKKLFATDPPTIVTPTALYLNDTQFQKLDHEITFTNPALSSSTRIWRLVHRPALSINGFERDGNNYIPVNQSRLRTSEISSSGVSMSPKELVLHPGTNGKIRVHIQPPNDLDIQERWLYSGFLEFKCWTDKGEICGSSMVSYGGMHGYLAGIPILNPGLKYPALKLDRYTFSHALTKPQSLVSQTGPIFEFRSGYDQAAFAPLGKGVGGKHKGKGKIKKDTIKDLYRDSFERVVVGKHNQDWVQILISINFPTALLTIEAESVCDDDHGPGGGGDRIRLEIGGSEQGSFQIETDERLREAEQVVAQAQAQVLAKSRISKLGKDAGGVKNVTREKGGSDKSVNFDLDLDPIRLALMKERLARSQELAFMPSGLYMPYEGYSRVMLQPSAVEKVMRLNREKTQRNKYKSRRRRYKVNKKEQANSARPVVDRRRGADGGKGLRRRPRCLPRILGLIPNGFNPWVTRSGSSEDAIQMFSWMGDLLLQNHDAVARENRENSGHGSDGIADKGKGKGERKGHKKHKKKKKNDVTRALPNGRYRLVIKALKPWGVRGRPNNVERWSSPIITIKRGKQP
ncbi:hypothetical protein BX616_003547 [Lobosporangium transversale]|nr:hypothetical protein BX616_003547 [Lobosporangium transversale]